MSEREVELRGALGVYLDRAPIAVPKGALSDARNCRIARGHVRAEAMGWRDFQGIVLNGPPTLIDTFKKRDGTRFAIFGTKTDLYRYDTGADEVRFITPRYETGTVSVSAASDLVGGGAGWTTNFKVGDYIHLGASGQTDPDVVWKRIVEIVSGTTARMDSVAGVTNLAIAYTVRKTFTASDRDPWITETFYAAPGGVDLWIATNGVDHVVKWDGSATQVTSLPALGFTCRYLRQSGGMMLYIDLLESGERKSNVIRTSAIADPENVSTLEATEFNGNDASDRVLAALPLGDVVAVYGEGSASLIQYIGPPIYWVVRTLTRERGILSSRAVIDRGDYHSVLATDGAYRFDGVRAEEFGAQVFREVVRKVALDRLVQTIGFLDMERAEELWIVPLADDGDPDTSVPTTAYSVHYLEEVGPRPVPIMVRDLPATAIGLFYRTESLTFDQVVGDFAAQSYRFNDRFFNESFPAKLFGMADGSIMELNAADSQDGDPIVAFARFGRIPLSDGIRRGFVQEVEPIVEELPAATQPLEVRVYGADRAEAAKTLRATVEHDLTGAGQRWHRPRVCERFADFELRTEGVDRTWAAWGLRAKIREAGRR